MKKESVNQFNQGMNLDLHPMVTPNSVLTDNLNGTFITYNGNEFCLQNDKGNFEVAHLSEDYVPIGAKEYNGIIYIVSVKNGYKDEEKEIIDPSKCLTEIGTYPGVIWENVDREKEYDLKYDMYTPLGNYKDSENDNYGAFTNVPLGYTTQTPVTIEIQPSYDGSVNLILTDGVNPVRMINSGFSVLPQNKYKLIQRNVETNVYESTDLQSIELIKNATTISNVELVDVLPGGQLKGGNYTFYIKFGDGDYNQTDVIAESSIVSIFKGTNGKPTTISGTLLDERTDKSIRLQVTGIDTAFSKIYVYYTREYSDTLGYRLTEAGVLKEPFIIKGDPQDIFITGFEQIETINIEELNVDYHTFDSARAMTQQQSMLFLGNLTQKDTWAFYNQLKISSSIIRPQECQSESGNELEATTTLFNGGSEYYDVHNIYYRVGYWPDEFYRFGIVYILSDGSTTPVFNVWGNVQDPEIESDGNIYGVWKTKRSAILSKEKIKPIYFKFDLSGIDFGEYTDKIKGYFIVRQKRIPTTLCQGLSIGIDQRTHLPITWNGANWITESFLWVNRHKAYEECTINGGAIWDPNIKKVWSYLNHTNNSYAELDPKVELRYTNTRLFKEAGQTDRPDYLWSRGTPEQIFWATAINPDTGNVYTDFNEWFDKNGSDAAGDHFFGANSMAQLSNNSVWKTEYTPIYKYNASIGEYEAYSATKTILYISEDPRYDNPLELTNVMWYPREPHTPDKPDEYGSMLHIESPSDYSEKYDINDGEEDKYKFISYGHTPEWDQSKQKNGSGLLSLDPSVVPSIRNVLDGSQFTVRKEYDVITSYGKKKEDYYANTNNNSGSYLLITEDINSASTDVGDSNKCVYIAPNTNVKTVDNFAFSNVAGNSSDFRNVAYSSEHLGVDWKDGENIQNVETGFKWCAPVTAAKLDQFESGNHTKDTRSGDNLAGFNSTQNINVIRGLFTPYVGVTTNTISDDMGIYSIRLENGGDEDQYLIRKQDESPYFTVSKRQLINNSINVYQGDCFTCTVGIRILTNFVDTTAPAAEIIVDPTSWRYVCYYHRFDPQDKELNENNATPYSIKNVNLSDVNNVNLGYWVTFKCLSSYNLGLRSLDYSYADEQNLLGSPRSFFPLNGGNTATGNKMPESLLLNDGYSATVSEKRFNLFPDVPYQISEFANRIIFSNVYVEDSFVNGYRTFQGLSYKDYDKQYGAIVKLVPWDNNLLVVMEHGVGLVGVNEKALMQTNTADTIHIYGHGVLSDQMQIISPDFGSKYEHSVIRTPIGVYGIDTDARKIWRFSTQKGFETLSDMKIESYLNDELPNVNNKGVEMEICDIRTHYNETKGDIMFSFFKSSKNVKKTAKKDANDYFSISTAKVEMSMNDTKSVIYSTNLPNNRISIDSVELVSAIIDYNNKKLVITSSGNYGTGKVVINGKTIPVKVNSIAEDFAKEQQQNSTDAGTTPIIEHNEETGEDEIVVVSNVKAVFNKNTSQVNHGDYTYQKSSIGFKFTDNTTGITVNDCDVVVEGVNAEITKLPTKIQFTATTSGNMVIKMLYQGREIGKSGVIVIKSSEMDVSTTRPIVYVGYTEAIMCTSAATKKAVTTNIITGSQCVDVSIGPDGRKVIFTGKKEGVAQVDVSDGTTTIGITVTVKNDVPPTDLIWYVRNAMNSVEYHSGDTLTLRKGTIIDLPYKMVPEDYNHYLYFAQVSSAENEVRYDPNIISYDTGGGLTAKNVGSTHLIINVMKVNTDPNNIDESTGQVIISEIYNTYILHVVVTE